MDITVEELKKYKTLTDIAHMLGYSYLNGGVRNKIISLYEQNNINILDIIKQNKKKYCLYCGKEISDGILTKSFAINRVLPHITIKCVEV